MAEQVDLKTIPVSPGGDHDGDQDDKQSGISADDMKQKLVTVFHDKDNFNVKHPLQNRWTLWFTKPPTPGRETNWGELLKEVITFNSVEEFWGIYNNVAPVTELSLKSDYHLFKDGVRPEWEDPQNKNGGKWSYSFKSKSNVDINEVWLHTMMAAIGETLEEENDAEVMGVVVNVRKAFYRVGVWTRSKPVQTRGDGNAAAGKARSAEKHNQTLTNIGRRFKEILKLPPSELVEFSGHTDAAAIGSSRAKTKDSV